MAAQKQKWALAPGVCLSLELGAEPSQIYSLAGARPENIAAKDRDLVLGLIAGLSVPDSKLEPLHRAIDRGLVQRRGTLRDVNIEHILQRLGQIWQWQAPTGQQGRLFNKLYRRSLRAHAQRKVFVQGFGQTPCLPETSVRRAMLCGSEKQRVLCVGDDDLMSVPLALLGHQVRVYDVDNLVLLPFLRRLAEKDKLDIQAQFYDLTQARMAEQIGSSVDVKAEDTLFDWVLTDPMSTRACFELFLSRALEHLAPGGHIACTVHPAALQVFEQVREQLGLELESYHAGFNHYYNESFVEDSYRSDMAVLVVSETSHALLEPQQVYAQDLFAGVDNYRQHAWCELRPGLRYYSVSRLQTAMRALVDSGLYKISKLQWFEDQANTGFVASLRNGGQVMATAPVDGQFFYFSATPYNEARDEQALAIVQNWLPHSSVLYGNGVARTHRPILGLVPD